MSLSGNLGFVSLDEVLRLLARSNQQGSVDVRGEQLHGRVFIGKGGVGLATTSDDDALHRHLIKSGLVDEDSLREIASGRKTLSSLPDDRREAVIDLIREMTVESIYQLGMNGEIFEVYEETTSNFASPKPFELEALLADSKQRLTDWAEVSRVVEDLGGAIHFVRDLGEREDVKVDREAWKVLSEVGSGSSVSEIAEQLGTTEFWAARITARLIEQNLVAYARAEASTPLEGGGEPSEDASTDWAEPAGEWPEREEEVETPEPAAEESMDSEDLDPDQSWWREPEEEPEAPAAEETSDVPDAPAGESDEVEEDTEAFLEKVFSELESPQEPQEEGYGLLRRRKLGASRDTVSDS